MSIVNDYKYKKDLKVTSQNDANTTIEKAQSFTLSDGAGPRVFDSTVKDLSGQTTNPAGVTEKNGNFFVTGGDTVYEYDSNWNFVTSYSISGQTIDAQGITVGANGNFYVADSENTSIREYDSTFTLQNSYDVSGNVSNLIDVHQRNSDNHWYVFDESDNTAHEYDETWTGQNNPQNYGNILNGSGDYQGFFEVDGGNWWICDTTDSKIFETSSQFNSSLNEFQLSSQISSPADTVKDSNNNWFIIDETDTDVSKYIPEDEQKTGTGETIINWNDVNDAHDLAVSDQYGNILNYEVEEFDSTAKKAVIWVYNSWNRDDSTQPQLLYGANTSNTDRQNTEATWNNTSQKIETVQHFEDNPLTATDSTPNNYDGTVNGASSVLGGQFNSAASFDGSNNIEFLSSNMLSDAGDKGTVSTWVKFDETTSKQHIFDSDTNGSNRYRLLYDGANSKYVLYINDEKVKEYSTTPSTNTWYYIVVTWDTANETYKIIENTQPKGTNLEKLNKDLEVTNLNDDGSTIDKAQPVILGPLPSFDIQKLALEKEPEIENVFTISGASWKPDGTKFFLISDDTVRSYDASEPFNAETLSFNNSYSVSSQTDNPNGLEFNDNGTKMYVGDIFSENIYEYDLNTAYNIGNVTFNQSKDISNNASDVADIRFNDDGTKFYVTDDVNESINSYTLSTPYDISTLSYNQSFDTSSYDSEPQGIRFNNDGTKMFWNGTETDNLFSFDLTTAYDIGTASFNVSVEFFDRFLGWNDTGTKLYFDELNSEKIDVYKSEDSGSGDIALDWTKINDEKDIAVKNENGATLPYEIESFDSTNKNAVLWAYDSWVRDDTVQAQVVYGGGVSASEDITGTWDNTGQNAVMVQHLQDDPLTATDSTGNNNDGTVNGAVSTTGQFDGAASFNNTDDNIATSLTGNEGTSAFAISTWVKIENTFDDIDYVLSNYDGSNGFILSKASTSEEYEIRFFVNGDPDLRAATNAVPIDEWFYLVAKRDSDGTASIYINGALENSDTGNGDITSTSDVEIGSRPDTSSSSNWMGGDIDELKFYNESLTPEQIQAEYDASPKGDQRFFFSKNVQTRTVTSSNPDNFYIGSDYTNSNNLVGDIDEFKVYNKTLSTTEIQAEYDSSPKNNEIFFSQEPSSKFSQTNETTTLNTSQKTLTSKTKKETPGVSDTQTSLLNKKLSETTSAIETLQKKADFFRNRAETTTLADNNAKKAFQKLSAAIQPVETQQTSSKIKISQPINLSTSIKETNLLKTLNQNLQPDDTISKKAELFRNLQEANNIQDSVNSSLIFFRSNTEQIAASTSTLKKLNKQISRPLQITDSDIQRTEKTVSTNLNTSDTEKTSYGTPLQETTTLNANQKTGFQKNFLETINTIETQKTEVNKKLSQQTSLTAQQTIKTNKKLVETTNIALNQEIKFLKKRTEQIKIDSVKSIKTKQTLKNNFKLNESVSKKEAKPVKAKLNTVDTTEKTAELLRTQKQQIQLNLEKTKELKNILTQKLKTKDILEKTLSKKLVEPVKLKDAIEKIKTIKGRRDTGIDEPNQVKQLTGKQTKTKPVKRNYNEAEKL